MDRDIERNSMTLNSEKGFTLIEILIVLVIISVLASLAAVGPEFIRNENISKTSRELAGDLQRTRQDAMTSGTLVNSMGSGIRFANPTSYTIFEFNDADADFRYDDAGEEANTIQRNLSSSIVIDINGANPDNNVLLYDKLGIPRNPEWKLSQMTIVIRHESSSSVRQKCVVVSTNRVREGLWDGSNCQEQ